ncbi:MAG: hypothetical protein DWQ02_01855 [Bacteroidetes bacterium]|nr:MAG: hypothetical protein DWQ02_01855 [Bacteroidota bacterium]
MKTNQFISGAKVLVVFLLMIVTFFRCTVSGDGFEDMEPAEDISFQIDIKKIRATDIKESESSALEVYGVVSSRLNIGTITDERELWSVDADNYLSVDFNDMQLSGSVTFTISKDDLSGSTITTVADLMELDFSNPDDDLGLESSTISLSEVESTEEFQLTFVQSGGQNVSLSYSITRL